jgi:DNA (cytosine-5)-methyltransferase 1
LGYVTHERILNGKEWGALENRNRWCMVAVTHGIEFDFDQLMPPSKKDKRLGDVLEPLANDDPRWSTMQGLKDKEARDLAEGKGFKMQIFDADADSIGTITKGYAKVRSTDPKIRHPENPDLLRQLTAKEHALLKEVPAELIENLSNTTAHEVLGQGIVYSPFKDLGQHVGNALNRFAGYAEIPFTGRELVDAATADMAEEVLTSLRLADKEQGQYVGSIVVAGDGVVIQDVGRGAGVVHQLSLIDDLPKLGASVELRYAHGQGKVVGTRAKGQAISKGGIAA